MYIAKRLVTPEYARTETDNVTNAWTAVKTVEVELPFENATHGWEKWQLIGAEWPQEAEEGVEK